MKKPRTRIAQSLVQAPNTVALIGNPSADYEYVDHKFYNDNKIPLIALASSETDVTRKSQWVFSMIYTDDWQGALISAYVKEILEATQVLVIRAENMRALSDSFIRHSGINGLGIVVGHFVRFRKRSDRRQISKANPRGTRQVRCRNTSRTFWPRA